MGYRGNGKGEKRSRSWGENADQAKDSDREEPTFTVVKCPARGGKEESNQRRKWPRRKKRERCKGGWEKRLTNCYKVNPEREKTTRKGGKKKGSMGSETVSMGTKKQLRPVITINVVLP